MREASAWRSISSTCGRTSCGPPARRCARVRAPGAVPRASAPSTKSADAPKRRPRRSSPCSRPDARADTRRRPCGRHRPGGASLRRVAGPRAARRRDTARVSVRLGLSLVRRPRQRSRPTRQSDGRGDPLPARVLTRVPTLDDLRRVIRRIEGARPARPAPEAIEKVLGGDVVETEAGAVLAVHHEVALEQRCGSFPVGDACGVAPSLLRILAPTQTADIDARGLLFLDTETTGLAGGTGTYAVLVGVARFDGGRLRLTDRKSTRLNSS